MFISLKSFHLNFLLLKIMKNYFEKVYVLSTKMNILWYVTYIVR